MSNHTEELDAWNTEMNERYTLHAEWVDEEIKREWWDNSEEELSILVSLDQTEIDYQRMHDRLDELDDLNEYLEEESRSR